MINYIQAHCNVCVGFRNHQVIAAETRMHHYYDEDDDSGTDVEEAVKLAKCCGCGAFTMIQTMSDGHTIERNQFPSPASRRVPEWLFEIFLEDKVENPVKHAFIKEIYTALSTGSLRLATLGIRALLEHVMIEHVGDKKTFGKNLDAFQEDGYISKKQREAIEPVLEAGHASMHRGFAPTYQDVTHLLDVTENLLQSIYIYGPRSAALKIPQRAKS
ncbi:DUF4145 domain-containing protein [Duganella callida]|uniref:DUF4145 domain-containing protein n=1 Tax=Duganella callida TaxID=2561932 RepID=A0A4Y9SBE2_9BURK|nr:DUF4145 domain-containing protein [Duganella callida]TFW17970.1 DUF4145 domain-containing protein [Duganella callida]